MERLYNVGLKHKTSGQKINLQVWAKDPMEATGKLTNSLIGWDKEYIWTGTGPVYKDNELVERRED